MAMVAPTVTGVAATVTDTTTLTGVTSMVMATEWEWIGAEYQSNNGHYGDSSRSRVSELQRRLSRAGYYRGSVDGVLGPQTRRAIRAYEQDHDNAG